MSTVKEITQYFEKLVPSEMKMDYDNVGLLVGLREVEVKRVLVALDITDEVIGEARAENAQMVFSHHPLFRELKQICDDSATGAKIVRLIQGGISALCLHTNLDQVKGGVNDALAEKLGMNSESYLDTALVASGGESYGMGRIGTIKRPMSMDEFLSFAKSALGASGLRYHDAGKSVHKLAICGGSGGNYVETAHAAGCDTLLTADIKHHEFLTAKALGLNTIDGGHYHTENVIVPVLAEMLKKGFPELEIIISKAAGAPMEFYT